MTEPKSEPALVEALSDPQDPTWRNPDQVLREEVFQIHGVTIDETVKGNALCRELYDRNSTALSLSGGGVRSASFNLGVIEALAVSPRTAATSPSESDTQVDAAGKSLLAQFNYLSTVSGGGYIGSWLSAWIARDGFAQVWPKLVGRREYPEVEAPELVWLRSYSNFLTPHVGLFSADTWAGIALVVRNLILNWLVIIPVICLALFAIKLLAVLAYWLVSPSWTVLMIFAGAAALLLIFALRFPLVNRPSCNPGVVVSKRDPNVPGQGWGEALGLFVCKLLGCPPKRTIVQRDAAGAFAVPTHAAPSAAPGARPIKTRPQLGPQHNEKRYTTAGGNEYRFLFRCLLPALVSALLLSLYLTTRYVTLSSKPLWWTALVAVGAGVGTYLLSWLLARWQVALCADPSNRPEERVWRYDCAAWVAAGAVYGAVIGVGIHMLATTIDAVQLDRFCSQLCAAGVCVVPDTVRALALFIVGMPWIIVAQLTAEMIFVGLTSYMPHSDEDREWFGRSTGWFAAIAIGWLCATFLVLAGPPLASLLFAKFTWAKYGTTILGAVSGAAGTYLGKSGKSAATDQNAKKEAWWVRYIMPISTVTFLILLVVGLSAAIDDLVFDDMLVVSPLLTASQATGAVGWDSFWFGVGFGIVLAISILAAKFVNINRFSIHSLYRNRLIRAYLGASNHQRAPNPFTGFDQADNRPMALLWRKRPEPAKPAGATLGTSSQATEKKTAVEAKPGEQKTNLGDDWQPFHIVNIALNVVSSKRLAWQERKAEPFTASPLHCGSAANMLGYRPTDEYAKGLTPQGLTIGTALAISGAAASPNMGYNSSPLVTLLLALFNVRLGWWLGNPGKVGRETYKHEGPHNAIKPFLYEMFGQTTDDWDYVYLSDGGHFENLGVYEMIRRRCQCIVVSDAGADPNYEFTDLGNATRKIAIDLGVYIQFSELREIKRRSRDNTVIEGAYYAVGVIDYKSAPEQNPGPTATQQQKEELAARRAKVTNGYILYIKPSYLGTESAGIVSYAAANAAFPHEPTFDLFYGESQFESYRTLGFEIVDTVIKQARARAEKLRDKSASPTADYKLCELLAALNEPEKPAESTLVKQIVDALSVDAADELRVALRESVKKPEASSSTDDKEKETAAAHKGTLARPSSGVN